MKKLFSFFLTGFILLLTTQGHTASVSDFIVTSGEAVVENITPELARDLALKRARLDAIEQVCGVRLQAETFFRNATIQDDFIHTVSYGQIVSEEVLEWKAGVYQDSKTSPPAFTYQVIIKTRVQKIDDDPDPLYRVNLKLNKTVFQSGEEMVIHVGVSKPSYITILNFCADGGVVLLFPNKIRRDNQMKPGTTYQIPTDADRRDVIKFQVSTLPGHQKDTEYIKVIATREPIELIDGLSVKGQFGVLETVQFATTEVARLVSSIPIKSRSEATVAYEVVNSLGR